MEKRIQEATFLALAKHTEIYSASAIKQASHDFFEKSAFDRTFFHNYSAEELCEFLLGYMSSRARGDKKQFWSLNAATGGFVITTRDVADQREVDLAVDELFLTPGRLTADGEERNSVSVRCYYSNNAVKADGLSMYIVRVSPWKVQKHQEAPAGSGPNCSLALGSQYFYSQNSPEVAALEHRKAVVARYDATIAALRASIAHNTVANVTEVVAGSGASGSAQFGGVGDSSKDTVLCLQLGIDTLHGASYFSSLSLVLARELPHSRFVKRIVETFKGGQHVYTFFIANSAATELKDTISHLHMLPARSTTQRLTMDLFVQERINIQEALFATAATIFSAYFTPSRQSPAYKTLARVLRHDDGSLRKLNTLNDSLFRQIVNEQGITEAVLRHVALFKGIFQMFVNAKNCPETETEATAAKLRGEIERRFAPGSVERDMVSTVLVFGRSVLRTNMFRDAPAALAFRLDPQRFFGELHFPREPFAIYMVIGAHFRAFHVRFQDIARGGIRIIRTPPNAPKERYFANRVNLFAECFGLAYTQTLKNKDIPESGSKGAILVSLRAASSAPSKTLYLQFVDSMLDCMLEAEPGVTSHAKLNGSHVKGDVLFFGPDEGSADDFPTIAAMHARRRGYPFASSLTTGKSPAIGGVPHDVDGMTTRGVRVFVNSTYEKMGIDGSKQTKFIVGGPDGDLGSNEILQGTERIVAMCDGFASVFDTPELNREELVRLAKTRKSLAHFDKSKISAAGFKVLVSDRNVTLPDGTVVENGETFRNLFHFSKYSDAGTFVPCGGRPSSVTLDNVFRCFSTNTGAPVIDPSLGEALFSGGAAAARSKIGENSTRLKWSIIVEGANLFFTNEARIALEHAGAVVFKDASTNKGGVCASSNEVLAGLALSAEQHGELMCVKPAAGGAASPPPPFYMEMKRAMIDRIETNAKREFECLWRETTQSAAHDAAQQDADGADRTRTATTDALSLTIFRTKELLMKSDLLQRNERLFRYLIDQYLPAPIKRVVPLDQVMSRVPKNYQLAIAASSVASQFGYRTGPYRTNLELEFFEFMAELTRKAEGIDANSSKL